MGLSDSENTSLTVDAFLRPSLLFLLTQRRKQQEGQTSAASHLLDLLDLRVVVARRDLWV